MAKKKYAVTVLIDATVTVLVEAENEEEAKRLGLENAPRPCICHRCADELEVGEPYGVCGAEEIED